MICSDIWHKYHEWYLEIVIRNLRQFWNITIGIYAKYHLQIMLLFVYTTTRKRFVIFALSQSNCSNFPCSWNITSGIYAKYHAQIMLLFVYTTTHKRFVIFTCGYFKLSWNTTALSQSNCRNFWCSSINAKYHVQIMLLFVYTTTRKRFVIFTCRYFKLSWNTTALSQSNCRNFSCSSINLVICFHFVYLSRCQCHELPCTDRSFPD